MASALRLWYSFWLLKNQNLQNFNWSLCGFDYFRSVIPKKNFFFKHSNIFSQHAENYFYWNTEIISRINSVLQLKILKPLKYSKLLNKKKIYVEKNLCVKILSRISALKTQHNGVFHPTKLLRIFLIFLPNYHNNNFFIFIHK